MNSAPMLRRGTALVIFDGPRRVIWRRTGSARWTPRRVWPSRAEATEVADAVHHGHPVLIVLEQHPEPVPVLAEELATAPATVAELAGSPVGEVTELTIPTLTWLPAKIAWQGHQFLHQARERLAQTPALLIPPLILESAGPPAANVWFGLRTHPRSWSADHVTAVLHHLLTQHPTTSRTAS